MTGSATVDLLRAHQVVAELIVAHDLRVQHLDYHPGPRNIADGHGRLLVATTVTVAVPSEPAELIRWCQVLQIPDVSVRVRAGDHDLVATAISHELRWRITTTLRGATRDRFHGRIRWDRHDRTRRQLPTGTALVTDLDAVLWRTASTTSTT